MHRTPPVEGTQIYFSCPPGLLLSGPNLSMCMENEEWEPTPREVECEGTSDNIITGYYAHTDHDTLRSRNNYLYRCMVKLLLVCTQYYKS